MHCKSTLRRVTLFSEGIHTPEYTLFLPSTCPINRDHLNLPNLVSSLIDASPPVLTLFLAFAAIGLSAFAIYVVHATVNRRDR